jgi:hypothetical protein
MKKCIIFLFMFIEFPGLRAQDTVSIGSGTQLRTTHDIHLVFNNMNLKNDGSYVQSLGDGITKLTGHINSSTSGKGTTALDEFEILLDNGYLHTLKSPVSILNVLTLSSGQLVSGGNLTIRSWNANTARVAPITSLASPAISGDVHVERYLSAHKGWRLLSVPTNSTESIQQAWQEGCGANLA